MTDRIELLERGVDVLQRGHDDIRQSLSHLTEQIASLTFNMQTVAAATGEIVDLVKEQIKTQHALDALQKEIHALNENQREMGKKVRALEDDKTARDAKLGVGQWLLSNWFSLIAVATCISGFLIYWQVFNDRV